jgi:dTDP-glucose 4,6-dehydratase
MRINDGRAIPAFMSQALRGEDITVFGEGNQTRSICYVDDLIDGIYRLLISSVTEPVNVGNPDEIPILQLAKEIQSLTKTKSRIIFRDLPEDDPKIRQPDIRKAKNLLGWEPKVNRLEGLQRTLDYFRSKILP